MLAAIQAAGSIYQDKLQGVDTETKETNQSLKNVYCNFSYELIILFKTKLKPENLVSRMRKERSSGCIMTEETKIRVSSTKKAAFTSLPS